MTYGFLTPFLAQVDTTAIGYRIGYSIGSWLPFVIIAILALVIILKGYRHGKE